MPAAITEVPPFEQVELPAGVSGPVGGHLAVVRAGLELVGVVRDGRVERVGGPGIRVTGPHDRQLLVDREAVGVIGALTVLPDEGADVADAGPDL